VQSVKPGDRVAWTGIRGGYAEYVAAPADRLVVIPAGVGDRQAAAVMLQTDLAQSLSGKKYSLRLEANVELQPAKCSQCEGQF
jgi:NADPH:quinone reductase